MRAFRLFCSPPGATVLVGMDDSEHADSGVSRSGSLSIRRAPPPKPSVLGEVGAPGGRVEVDRPPDLQGGRQLAAKDRLVQLRVQRLGRQLARGLECLELPRARFGLGRVGPRWCDANLATPRAKSASAARRCIRWMAVRAYLGGGVFSLPPRFDGLGGLMGESSLPSDSFSRAVAYPSSSLSASPASSSLPLVASPSPSPSGTTKPSNRYESSPSSAPTSASSALAASASSLSLLASTARRARGSRVRAVGAGRGCSSSLSELRIARPLGRRRRASAIGPPRGGFAVPSC